MEQADPTNAELVSILERRADPHRLRVVVLPAVGPGEEHDLCGELALAEAFVAGECTSERPAEVAAYGTIDAGRARGCMTRSPTSSPRSSTEAEPDERAELEGRLAALGRIALEPLARAAEKGSVTSAHIRKSYKRTTVSGVIHRCLVSVHDPGRQAWRPARA